MDETSCRAKSPDRCVRLWPVRNRCADVYAAPGHPGRSASPQLLASSPRRSFHDADEQDAVVHERQSVRVATANSAMYIECSGASLAVIRCVLKLVSHHE